jgi:hypothetical protein
MQSMEEWCKEHGIVLSQEQIVADKYLRSRNAGRFMIDWGYGNVVKKADELFAMECFCIMQTMNGEVN